MIVRRSSTIALLFALRGSILPTIAPNVLIVLLVSTAALFAADRWPRAFVDVGSGAFALVGVALSIFLGFRNNAAYDRCLGGKAAVGAADR